MNIAGRKKLTAFSQKHAQVRSWIELWLREVKRATWKGPQDIKDRYQTASFLPDNRVVFNIKGKKYRMETQFAYKRGKVAIKWIGTHAEYTKHYK